MAGDDQDKDKKGKGAKLSDLIEGMIGDLDKLKNSSFSEEDLRELGIASSFKNLPCTFDIRYTKEGLLENKTTLIKSSLKQILTGASSPQVDGTNRKSYLTYVEVSIEHHVISSKLQVWAKRIILMVLIGVVVLAAVWGVSCLIKHCVAQKNEAVNSCFTVRQFDGTNLMQKVEMKMNYEEREK